MTYKELLQQIKARDFAPVYLLLGTEGFFVEDAQRRLLEAVCDAVTREFNVDILYGGEVDGAKICDIANAFPMMSERRIVIVREVHRLSGAGLERLANYVERPLKSTVLILAAEKLDGRNKAIQRIKAASRVVECKPLYDREVPNWVRGYLRERGYEISDQAVLMIQARVGNQLREMVNELEKIVLNMDGGRKIEAADVQDVVGLTRNYSIFDLTDAIGQKDLRKALFILEQMLQAGEQATGILAMIARHFVNLYKIRGGLAERSSQKRLAELTGIPPYFIKKTSAMARNYDDRRYGEIFSALAETDLKLKTSREKPHLALELLLLQLIRGGKEGA